jgi:hypothetical protein
MNWRALDLFRSSHSLPPAMGLVTDNLDNPDFTSRTTWNIVLSCIVTVLACSWAAIHPNISYPANRLPQGSKRWGRHLCTLNGFIRDQMFPIVVFIISPEFILAWAMRQRRQAKHMIAGTGTYMHLGAWSACLITTRRTDSKTWVVRDNGRLLLL